MDAEVFTYAFVILAGLHLLMTSLSIHQLLIKNIINLMNLLGKILDVGPCRLNFLDSLLSCTFLLVHSFLLLLLLTFNNRLVIRNLNRTSSINDNIEKISIIIILKHNFIRFKELKLHPFSYELKIIYFPVISLLLEDVNLLNQWYQMFLTVSISLAEFHIDFIVLL
jgi:hypothetical protein